MVQVTLGTTGITVEKNSFGALPIQRISKEEAVKLLRKAYEHGVTFFDTARFYTDSEEKVGEAFKGMREKVYIATKTGATTVEAFWKDLHTSLNNLQTDYIDIYQFHNPSFCPKPGDGTGLYEAMLEAKEKGMIRHIGITNHRLHGLLPGHICGCRRVNTARHRPGSDESCGRQRCSLPPLPAPRSAPYFCGNGSPTPCQYRSRH